MHISEIPTPALCVDLDAVQFNLDRMAAALPEAQLRPHVKAHKSTALARLQQSKGHIGFTCATPREVIGMAQAELGGDLLLANETLDLSRLRAMAELPARVTVAVDSPETIAAAATSGIVEVLIDVNVGLPRCGCDPDAAGRLADLARSKGLQVRGVMGYEGHLMGEEDPAKRAAGFEASIEAMRRAADLVGGEIVSMGGTGTYELHRQAGLATEVQAGSYVLMDTAYGRQGLGFRQALTLHTTVLSVNAQGWAVCDGGLKSLGMDHGNPTIDGATVWFCSDEHITFSGGDPVWPGDRVVVVPAHVDPTMALHDHFFLTQGDQALAMIPIDLRGW